MPVIFGTESLLQLGSQTLSIFTAGSMIKIDISLLSPASTVHMNKDGALIITLIFPVQSIDSLTTLAQTSYLIQWNRLTHTCFPLAVVQNGSLTYPILFVLNNEIHLSPSFQKFPSQTENNIVCIFIFVKFFPLITTNTSRIRSSMTAYQVKDSSFQ